MGKLLLPQYQMGGRMRLIAVLIVAGALWSGELLTNGGFEEPLSVGWTKAQYGANILIERSTGHHPDPDYEVYIYKGDGRGYGKIYQTVNITTLDLRFQAQLRFITYASGGTAWAAAALVISYLSSSNTILGETRICNKTTYCPWRNSSRLHLINAPIGSWNHFEFNIDEELVNLPGVDPSQIAKIRIAVFDTCYDC